MKLRKEFQAIVDEVYASLKVGTFDTRFALEAIAERCQALADKPPKMLTDEEIEELTYSGPKYLPFARAIELAHIAKQKEPETKTVQIWQQSDGRLFMCADDTKFANCTLKKTIEITI